LVWRQYPDVDLGVHQLPPVATVSPLSMPSPRDLVIVRTGNPHQAGVNDQRCSRA
jgi:hypothetical protein